MTFGSIFLSLLALGAFSFFFGRRRIRTLAAAAHVKQHSRDVYHGSFLVVCTTFVPLILLILWSGLSPLVIDGMLEAYLQARSMSPSPKSNRSTPAPSMKRLSTIRQKPPPLIMAACSTIQRPAVRWR